MSKHLKPSSWELVKETLSDGSTALNVTNGEIVLHAVDDAAALRVLECLSKDTVD